VRFADNESHCQRRHSLNLGGGAPFGPPNSAGVGPDVQHPFLIRNTKLWNVHWGISPVSASVLLDGLTIYNAEYGVWRPEYKDHFYRNISFTDVPKQTQYAFTTGKPNDESQFPDLTRFQDDQPPQTVVTYVGPNANGQRLVRGVASDNGEVKAVTVNGQRAKSVRGDYSEWEIAVPVSGKLTAQATDAAGNVEPRPHVVSQAD
jgi:hypothetical protein